MFSLKAQDPGSGRRTPAKWHGTGACHRLFTQKPGTYDGIIRPTMLFLAWVRSYLELDSRLHLVFTALQPRGSGAVVVLVVHLKVDV